MPDPLNYRPSDSAVYYVAPSGIHVRRTIVGFVIAAVLAIIGGCVYGRIQPRLNILYVRGGAVLVAAGAVALLGLIPVRYGRVRIPVVAAFCGAFLALLALYAMWLVWVHDALITFGFAPSYLLLIIHPITSWNVIRLIKKAGTWSYRGDVASGPWLLVFWLGEAGIILAAGVLAPMRGLFSGDPTCRECGARCIRVPKLPRFGTDRQTEFLASIENRDFGSLASHPAAAHEDDPELTLRLMSCPRCNSTHILTVTHIAWYIDANRHARVQSKPLIDQLLVTAEEAEQIKSVCRQIQETRESLRDAAQPQAPRES